MRLRKIEKTNPNVVIFKLTFLLLLLGFGLLVSKSIKTPVVLPAKKIPTLTQLPKNISEVNGIFKTLRFDSIKKQADKVFGQILGETTEIVNKQASDAGSAATKYVFEAAVKPIVQQIDKLPKEQQEILKKQICR